MLPRDRNSIHCKEPPFLPAAKDMRSHMKSENVDIRGDRDLPRVQYHCRDEKAMSHLPLLQSRRAGEQHCSHHCEYTVRAKMLKKSD